MCYLTRMSDFGGTGRESRYGRSSAIIDSFVGAFERLSSCRSPCMQAWKGRWLNRSRHSVKQHPEERSEAFVDSSS